MRSIVIGASAGALHSLSQILPALPAGFPLPILIVVHIPRDRQNRLAPLFQAKCRMAVREGEDKEPTAPGTIYFAPPDYHLLIERDGQLSLSSDEEVRFSRPSIDVLFESAADAFGAATLGIILSGANADGARGLKAIADAGGDALVEDPAAAHCEAMPLAALSLCRTARVMPLDRIAGYLMETCAA